MELFVSEPLNLRCNPLDDKVKDHTQVIQELRAEVDTLKNLIIKVDRHYTKVCRSICATSGLVIKDVSGHTIQQEYLKVLKKE